MRNLLLDDTFMRMSLSATARRRWFGALVLLLALGMLVAGETVLRGRFPSSAFLFYWLICLVLTVLAIAVAFRDVKESARKALQDQKDLLETTLKEIETEAKGKNNGKKSGGQSKIQSPAPFVKSTTEAKKPKA
jgi:hypothetical protein